MDPSGIAANLGPSPALPPYTPSASSSSLSFLTDNPLYANLASLQAFFQERRKALNLANPGTVENVSREVVKDVFLTNHTFSGLRGELNRSFSINPIFQMSHAFSMGSQAMPPYTFAAVYGTNKTFMQAMVDNEGSVQARYNLRLSPSFIAKTSVQFPGGAMGSAPVLSLDGDYSGADFQSTIKSMNPSILEGGLTGIFIGSHLQSVTPHLALGLEAVYQRPSMSQGPETYMSYVARYATPSWVASAQFQDQGVLNATYWRKVADKVEAGVETNLALSAASSGGLMGPQGRQGKSSLGVKYDFRQSTFRAMIDTAGKLSCVLEKRVAPIVSLVFAGEMDHSKNAAKLGISVSIEQAPEEVMEMQEKAAQDGIQITAPSVPF